MAAVRGYLVVTVAEASGRNKDEDEVWDPSFYEGFVKGAPHSPANLQCKAWHKRVWHPAKHTILLSDRSLDTGIGIYMI